MHQYSAVNRFFSECHHTEPLLVEVVQVVNAGTIRTMEIAR